MDLEEEIRKLKKRLDRLEALAHKEAVMFPETKQENVIGTDLTGKPLGPKVK